MGSPFHGRVSACWLLTLAPLFALACQAPEKFAGFDAANGGSGGDAIVDAGFEPDTQGTTGSGGAIVVGSGGSGGSGGNEVIDAPTIDESTADQATVDESTVNDAVDIPPPVDANKDVAVDKGQDIAADVAPPIEPNLVGYWKFDEGSGTMARDSSPSGNDAVIHNTPTWLTTSASLPSVMFADPAAIGFNQTAYALPGTTSLPDNSARQTIATWFTIKALDSNDHYLVCLWNPSLSQAIAIGLHQMQLTAWKWGPTTIVSTAPPSLNAWHHLAYTYDGATHKLYLDGALVGMNTMAPNSAAVTRPELGAYNAGSLFNGAMDDLRIYNVALTAAQVAALASGKSSAFP